MTRFWRTVIAMAALALVLGSCTIATPSGNLTTESRPVSGFTAVELGGAGEVTIEADHPRHQGTCAQQSDVQETRDLEQRDEFHGFLAQIAPRAWSIGRMMLWTNTGGKRHPSGTRSTNQVNSRFNHGRRRISGCRSVKRPAACSAK